MEIASRLDQRFVRLLLGHGAEVNIKNNNGETPIYFAISSKRLENVVLLIKNGAYVNIKNNEGVSPLHVAVE